MHTCECVSLSVCECDCVFVVFGKEEALPVFFSYARRIVGFNIITSINDTAPHFVTWEWGQETGTKRNFNAKWLYSVVVFCLCFFFFLSFCPLYSCLGASTGLRKVLQPR